MPKITSHTKHFQVTQALRSRFARLKAGAEVPTVRELTEELGVAQGTVVQAMNALKSDGVIERPAGKMRLVVCSRHDHHLCRIAIIRPDWPSPDFDAVVKSIVQAGDGRNWGFEIKTYGKLQNVSLNRLASNCDAAVLIPNSEPFPDHLRKALQKPSRPTVVAYEPVDGLGVPVVSVDGEMCGELAVEHLAALGHRRILAVMSEPPSSYSMSRIEGWRNGMAGLGFSAEETDQLFIDCKCQPSQSSIEWAYEYLSKVLNNMPFDFTGVFFDDWTGALAGMRVFREMSIDVPNDLSVVSFSGVGSIAQFLNPALSAVEMDCKEYGQSVARCLADGLGGNAESSVVKLTPFMCPRQTSAPLIGKSDRRHHGSGRSRSEIASSA